MESTQQEVARHKDTLISANSYETSSSSKVCDKSTKRIPKRTSRISLQVESLMEKESILDANNSAEIKEQFIENTISPFCRDYEVKISIVTKVDENNDVLSSFTTELPGNTKIKQLIEISVDRFNEYFRGKEMNMLLLNTSKKCNLRPSKKNGMPKMDLPSIDGECYVADTQMAQFAFTYSDADLNKLCEKKKNKCERCLIL